MLGLTTAHQRRFAGGGPKKPAMPQSETNFDVVFVGKSLSLVPLQTSLLNLHLRTFIKKYKLEQLLIAFRWNQLNSSSEVLAV